MAKAKKRYINQVDSGELIAEEPQFKRERTSCSARHLRGNAETTSEEDLGHLQSQLFIKAAKGSQKQLHNSNDVKSLDEFKEAIQRSRAESQALGHNKIQEIQDKKTRLQQTFLLVVGDSIVDDDKENVNGETFAKAPSLTPLPADRKARALIPAAKELLQLYTKLPERALCSYNSDDATTEWAKHCTEMTKVLAKQGEKVKKEVRSRLGDIGILGNEIAATSLVEQRWGIAAKGVRKGLKRFLVYLADDGN